MQTPMLGVVLALALVACERRPKRTLRTEPWPAPAVSSATSSAAGPTRRYEIEESRVRIALGGKKTRTEASVGGVRGTVDLDPLRPERSRAKLRVDLLALSVASASGGAEDPTLTARALDWLELGAERGAAERERDRFAELEIQGFQPAAGTDPTARRGRAVGHGMLTLHHFRVPVEIDVEIDLGPEDGNRLTIRTQRPFVVSLAAHDILPRGPQGDLVAGGVSELGTTVGREARVSAELSARLVPPAPAR